MKKYGNSSYWLRDWENDDIVVSTMDDYQKKSHDIYKMASAKRAISNFVNIVTNQQIPVTFNTRGDSYTNGKHVVIGSEVVDPKDFDVAVGLALHEGSHIKLSDFKMLDDIYTLIPEYLKEGALKKGINSPVSTIKDIWNVVEDRRIDQYIFNSAPGYRDYYRAMYDKYFNDPLIDKGLLSDEFTEENLESYMFRIINLHNKNTNLKALNGLSKIYEAIGLHTISRLKSSKDTFDVALSVFRIILDNISSVNSDSQPDESNEPNEGGEGKSESREMTDNEFEQLMDSVGNNASGKSPMGGDTDSDSMGGTTLEVELPQSMGMGGKVSTSNSKDSNNEKVKLSERQKELLKKKISNQEKFLNGNISKKKISNKEAAELQAVEESDSELKGVGSTISESYGRVSRIQCVVARNMTRSLMESKMFPMCDNRAMENPNYFREPYSESSVKDGIRLGTILGKKLQVRGEDRSTVFNRQKNGKIDRRMISSLGFGNENVFQYMETDSYKKANLHVSIDASGSMGGQKWFKTMTNVVALCKAVDMIPNLSIQVSFRGSTEAAGTKPYIVMAYDSHKDKFSKVKQLFPYLIPGGTTPEGLCFEAIMDEFLSSNSNMDSYFLNISDGEPAFSGNGFYYSNSVAFEHTRKMVKKIEAMGIKTMSYYVDDYSWGGNTPSAGFIQMYGKGAVKVDITNIFQIIKTMNSLFLQK